MFRIGTGRTTWMAVAWTGLALDGAPVSNEVKCKVDLVDRSRLMDQRSREAANVAEDLNFATEVTKDIEGVENADGTRAEFSADLVAVLFDQPGFAVAWGQAYLKAWAGIPGLREGNLESSPDAGQPDAADAKPSPKTKATN